ncbi:MAG: lipoprotein-releasing ABC transporter ATP-binding protein LolD [Proteobacteria bacterium]|nr:lipoprotein-releasing ABC transporter ATP-binding protein LolD [Pseudomonadota bacterium]
MSDRKLECRNLSKSFNEGELRVDVLKDVNFMIESGQSVAIIGASGSGKSTLLHLLGGLDIPSNGAVHVNGNVMSELSDEKRGQLRNKHLGFVYQFHHLLPEFTALENVAMPLLVRRDSLESSLDKAKTLLDKVGLSKRLDHKPGELSGGERQRAAIARALVTEPEYILADEPTGNLDEKTADQVFDLFLELNKGLGTSLLMVTHNLELTRRVDRVLELKEGALHN